MISSIVAKPSVAPRAACATSRRAVVVRANPRQDELKKRIEDAIHDAEEVCATDDKKSCASAWDVVEELSAEKGHEAMKHPEEKDPLEKYCKTEPDADECRVHDN